MTTPAHTFPFDLDGTLIDRTPHRHNTEHANFAMLAPSALITILPSPSKEQHHA